MMAHIEVSMTDGLVRRFELTKNFLTIGRSKQADIQVHDVAMSQLHVQIERSDDDRWTISDLESTNGIRIGDRQFRSHVFRDGDVVFLGGVKLAFHDPSELSDDPEDATSHVGSVGGMAGHDDIDVINPDPIRANTSNPPSASQPSAATKPRRSSAMRTRGQQYASDDQAWVSPANEFDSRDGFSDLDDRPEPSSPGGPLQLAVLLRFKWTVLLVFSLLAGTTIPFIWVRTVPTYRASAKVRVLPIIPSLVFPDEERSPLRFYQSFLNTQVDIIRSPTVLERVLDQPEVQGTELYKTFMANPGGGSGVLLEWLGSNLEVEAQRNTEIIELAMILSNPRDATVILNAVLDQYNRFVKDSSERTDDSVYKSLLKESNDLRNQVEGREKITERLREQLSTSDPNELLAKKRVRLDEMAAEMCVLQRDIALAEWEKKELQGLVKRDTNKAEQSTSQPSNPQRYQIDEEWRRRDAEITTLRHRIAAESIRLGDGHPLMAELRERTKLAEASLRKREEQLDKYPPLRLERGEPGSNPAAELHVLCRQIERLKYKEQLQREQLEKERADLHVIVEASRTLAKENVAIRRHRELYRAVQKRIDEKTIERNRPGRVEVLNQAFLPRRPYKDSRRKLTLVALFGAFAAGLGAAILRSKASRSFHQARDVSPVCRAPFLGQIPFVRRIGDLGSEDSAALVESVRMVRTILLQRLSDQDGSVVLITGAGPGCGKTTVSQMLARSFAQCGKKVLLVDTDVRNPALSERLGIDRKPGLISALIENLPDDEIIVETGSPGLSVLPAGGSRNHCEAELFANGALEARLARWREEYDAIILDSAPVLPVADPAIISRHADGTIIVVREEHCRRTGVADAYQCLVSSGAKLLGTIFIGSDHGSGYDPAYQGYNYGSPVGQLPGEPV